MVVEVTGINYKIPTELILALGVKEEDIVILINNVINTFESVAEKLQDILKNYYEEFEEVLDVIIKKKCDYPVYKTKYRTVKFFNKKIYYNCRNTC